MNLYPIRTKQKYLSVIDPGAYRRLQRLNQHRLQQKIKKQQERDAKRDNYDSDEDDEYNSSEDEDEEENEEENELDDEKFEELLEEAEMYASDEDDDDDKQNVVPTRPAPQCNSYYCFLCDTEEKARIETADGNHMLHTRLSKLLDDVLTVPTINVISFFTRVFQEHADAREAWLIKKLRWPCSLALTEPMYLPEWSLESIVDHYTSTHNYTAIRAKLTDMTIETLITHVSNRMVPVRKDRPIQYLPELIRLLKVKK